MKIPENIIKLIGKREFVKNNIGMSGAQVFCFDDMVLKAEKQSVEADNEYKMLSWLDGKLPVPKILCFERENGTNFLLMSKVEGEMSCAETFLERPNVLTELLADALNILWSVDIADCPVISLLDKKLELAKERVLSGLCDTENVEPETYGENGFKSPSELLSWLIANKPKEEPAFSHGDFCLPNIFIKDDKINGFIDLGRGGIADKYQDIALCYRSLIHNFDGSYGGKIYQDFNPDILFEKLNIAPDFDKIRYYILLDELF